ncbi:MAG: molybdopterin converting factor subunit 1 [Planctomycetota bacterium]|jgi:molybdopterin converting factor subunit 1
MKIKYRFLGRFSEDMSEVQLPADVADGVNVNQLRCLVAANAPEIEARLMSCLVAVNTEYVDDDEVLKDGDEVAFLPPVSGG